MGNLLPQIPPFKNRFPPNRRENQSVREFMLKGSFVTADGETITIPCDDLEMLRDRIKIAEKAMSIGTSKVLF